MTYTILFVDDSEALLHMGKLFLEMSGMLAVDTALSGVQALEKLRCRRYDGILSDYGMSPMNGILLLEQVRAELGEIPFILFSSDFSGAVYERAYSSGADFCIRKGGNPQERFLDLETMFLILIEQSQLREKISYPIDLNPLSLSLPEVEKDRNLIVMNTPAGSLNRSFNGGYFFYRKK
ncbi:response regulator [Methanoregula sp. UBA64]|jgi:CheY-like chemotaxis protein|uniref:response regulator n=1 Tax=Methanoregula sp. UBA64 TaxID=1915554 RepID=UPI0025F027B0|nr:response regulator [Methanoregula sp. UBA64]